MHREPTSLLHLLRLSKVLHQVSVLIVVFILHYVWNDISVNYSIESTKAIKKISRCYFKTWSRVQSFSSCRKVGLQQSQTVQWLSLYQPIFHFKKEKNILFRVPWTPGLYQWAHATISKGAIIGSNTCQTANRVRPKIQNDKELKSRQRIYPAPVWWFNPGCISIYDAVDFKQTVFLVRVSDCAEGEVTPQFI